MSYDARGFFVLSQKTACYIVSYTKGYFVPGCLLCGNGNGWRVGNPSAAVMKFPAPAPICPGPAASLKLLARKYFCGQSPSFPCTSTEKPQNGSGIARTAKGVKKTRLTAPDAPGVILTLPALGSASRKPGPMCRWTGKDQTRSETAPNASRLSVAAGSGG